MKAPISIIVPVFNGAAFIRDGLDSICRQTVLPLEIIVADDASTDGTSAIVDEYARSAPVPIKLLRLPKNAGAPCQPVRRAFEASCGEFIAVLDADDLFEPNACETWMRMFAAPGSEEVGIVGSDYQTFDCSGVRLNSYFAGRADLMQAVINDSSGSGALIPSAEAIRLQCHEFCLPFKSLIRRTAWECIGGPNERFPIVYDSEFTWRLAAHSTFAFRVIKEPLVRVRVSPASLSTNVVRMTKELIRLFRQMLRDVSEPALRSKVRQRLEKELFDLAYYGYKQRQLRTCIPSAIDLALSRATGRFGIA